MSEGRSDVEAANEELEARGYIRPSGPIWFLRLLAFTIWSVFASFVAFLGYITFIAH